MIRSGMMAAVAVTLFVGTGCNQYEDPVFGDYDCGAGQIEVVLEGGLFDTGENSTCVDTPEECVRPDGATSWSFIDHDACVAAACGVDRIEELEGATMMGSVGRELLGLGPQYDKSVVACGQRVTSEDPVE